MSGLYSPINRLAESITRPKGTGAEYMTELQKKPGYKPAEAEDRDLQALMALPQMERAAFMEKLKAQANKFPLKMRELGQGQTHHEQYTLPGGENYREILLHTPMPEGKGFKGVPHHFGGMPNILASIMAKDRTSPEGKKILHLEEIQSDWHQQGRDRGYNTKDPLAKNESGNWVYTDPDGRQVDLGPSIDEETMRHAIGPKVGIVPYGPHSKDWHELALKAMIQHAAENGYDQIAINHGQTVADRYGLSAHVNEIAVPMVNPDGTRSIRIEPKEGQNIRLMSDANGIVEGHGANSQQFTGKHINDIVGQDMAAKIMQAKENGTKFAGEGLKVGGKGMKQFYDRMVPTFLNKFGKKHGVQVQQGSIDAGEFKVNRDSHPTTPYRVESAGSPDILSRHATPDEAWAHAEKLGQAPVHTFDITPAMREDVLKNGIPRYDEGGIIHKAEGGSMNLTTDQMRAALMGKSNTTSLSNLQSVGANEAPSLPVKSFIPPHGRSDNGSIPVGGVDENVMQPGQQMMPQQAPQQPPQPGQPQAGAQPQQGQPQPPQGPQSNILSMTPQGQAMAAMRPTGMATGGVARFDKGGQSSQQPQKNHPAIFPPAPAFSQQQIKAMAERIARQMTGESNPNQKTLRQIQREKDLPIDLRTTGALQDMPETNMTQHKGSFVVGVPGDTSVGGIESAAHDLEPAKAAVHLHGIGDRQLEHSVPMFGGKLYGAYGHSNGWAGNESGVQPLQNSAVELHKANPDAKILGQYIKMTPQSLDFALHNLDALLAYQEPHKFPSAHREHINKLLSEPYLGHKAYPASPGIDDPLELLLHAQMSSDFRKKIVKILSTKKNLPEGARSWEDVIFAISHPELRNLETGVSGGTLLEMNPHRNPKDFISPNPSYSYDLPSKVIAQTKYMAPADLAYPRSMHYAREHIKTLPAEKQKLVQPFGTAKMIGFREPIDEQHINQIGEYETQLRRMLLGKKKGGKVKLHTDKDTMVLELSRKQKVK